METSKERFFAITLAIIIIIGIVIAIVSLAMQPCFPTCNTFLCCPSGGNEEIAERKFAVVAKKVNPDRYLILLHPPQDKSDASIQIQSVQQSLNLAPNVTYQEAIHGYVAELSEAQRERIKQLPEVADIVPDLHIRTMQVGKPEIIPRKNIKQYNRKENIMVPSEKVDRTVAHHNAPQIIRRGPVTYINRDLSMNTQELTPSIASQSMSWGISRVHACAHALNGCNGTASTVITSSPVRVYVIDTGIDLKHPDLRVAAGVSFVPTEPTAQDYNGHGTHVAGIIGAKDNAVGVVGVCPDVMVYPVKVLDRQGSGFLSWITGGLSYVLRQKQANPNVPMVINMSLGGNAGTTAYNVMDLAVRNLVQHGVTCCVAAGNESTSASITTPAHTTEAITVGAYDINNVFANFSNYGSMVDVLAPGVNILSTYPNNRYAILSGTSMATPFVTGGVALYLVQHPTATPSQVQTALNSSATSSGNALISQIPAHTTNMSLYV